MQREIKTKAIIILIACCSLSVLQLSEAVPVEKGQPSNLAAHWLKENNIRLGKKMNQRIKAEKTFCNASSETIFYAVMLEPKGFIITPADDLISPVIAFSADGIDGDLSQGSPLLAFLERDLTARNAHALSIEPLIASKQTSKLSAKNAKLVDHAQTNKARWQKYTAAKDKSNEETYAADVSEDSYGGTSSLEDIRVAPLILSRWGQSTAQGQPCYNYYTPSNYLSGCVATALAQLMRFWEHPVNGIGLVTNTIKVNGTQQQAVTRGGDENGGAYNWSQMPLNPATAAYNLSEWQQIGSVCYDAGVIAGMQYSATVSASSILVGSKLKQYFGYGNAHELFLSGGIPPETRDQVLLSNIAAGYPVITGIRQTSNNSGHAVITDGLGYIDNTIYYHVNYGWGTSSATAWYNMPNMDSSPSFNLVDALIYNIFPANSGEIVAGRIVSEGAGLAGATVTLTAEGTNYTAVTDANGYYGLIVQANKDYTLTASKDGLSTNLLAAISVGASSLSTFGPCGNIFAEDLTLNVPPSPSIPTLGEWGIIIFMALLLYNGARGIKSGHFGGIKC